MGEYMVPSDWTKRRQQVEKDLKIARQSRSELAHLDIEALDKYLSWLRGREMMANAGKRNAIVNGAT